MPVRSGILFFRRRRIVRTEDHGSPDTLQEDAPDAGVRRLNKKPLIIVATFLTLAIIALVWGISVKKEHAAAKASAVAMGRREADKEEAAAVKKDAPPAGPIPESAPNLGGSMEHGLIPAALNAAENIDRAAGVGKGGMADKNEATSERRETMLDTAMNAPSRVAAVDELARLQRPAPEGSQGTASASSGQQKQNGAPAASESAANDPNLQVQKQSFAGQQQAAGYLGNVKQAPLSKYELKAGTIIPAIMISGINSDLPGQIIAHVSQNVYDSATGNYLLIPQGSRLVGVYDSQVAVGQERVQVVWTRLNFPDSSTLDLGNMAGADATGYSGFHDKVNNHFFRIFGDAIMLSLLSAGAQLSQPRTASTNGTPTTGQTVAAAMGQQFAATGAEITRRNMDIQPTLEIRPGYRFDVMVNKDVILEPYKAE
jgi:type IV secretion system protein VirB10